MVQIVKLLVATIVTIIFGYLLLFSFAEFSNNGGEYWDFDGRIDPQIAATNSFESGDYRFLYVSINRPLGDITGTVPGLVGCTFHDPNADDYLHMSQVDSRSGVDDSGTALAFAHAYNRRIGDLLNAKFPAKCGSRH